MHHHKHPGLVGRLASDHATLDAHPDTARDDAQLVWFPIADELGREVDALEGLTCVPTRAGAMRIVAVPHVATHLALGDEIAVADWDGEPLARGELASSLEVTIRVVLADDAPWHSIAARIDDAAATPCWYDVIADSAVAVSVPRAKLGAVVDLLTAAQNDAALRWEYATPLRHA